MRQPLGGLACFGLAALAISDWGLVNPRLSTSRNTPLPTVLNLRNLELGLFLGGVDKCIPISYPEWHVHAKQLSQIT